jgi:hypothetical protein
MSTGLTGVSAGPVHMLGTGLTGGDDRSDRCELKVLQLSCFKWCLTCIRPGGGALVQGELFVVFRALFRWFALFASAIVQIP